MYRCIMNISTYSVAPFPHLYSDSFILFIEVSTYRQLSCFEHSTNLFIFIWLVLINSILFHSPLRDSGPRLLQYITSVDRKDKTVDKHYKIKTAMGKNIYSTYSSDRSDCMVSSLCPSVHIFSLCTFLCIYLTSE